MRHLHFFIQGLKDFRTTGSFIPSQRFLIKALTAPIPKDAHCVVELGAGEGCVTRGIEHKVSDHCQILSFEINPKLVLLNKTSRKRTHIINDDVRNLKHHLNLHGIAKIDCIVSSLPFASIGKNDTEAILSVISKNMPPEGKFVQYQYSLLNRKDLQKYFSKVSTHFVLLNFLPAFVYTCTK